MTREDVNAMEAKARAALSALPKEFRAIRWAVGIWQGDSPDDPMPSIQIDEPRNPGRGHMVVHPDGGLSAPSAEHIAASDPHAVIALVAELRSVETDAAVTKMLLGLALSGDAALYLTAKGFLHDADGARSIYSDAMKWRAEHPEATKLEKT